MQYLYFFLALSLSLPYKIVLLSVSSIVNMKNSYSYILLLLLLVSCRSVGTISIDYLQPSDISFPPEVREVAIVNNTCLDDLVKRVEQINASAQPEQDELGVIDGDGKLAAEAFAAAIAEGNYFDHVLICDSALRAKDRFPRDCRLSMEEVQTLTENLRVDMLLSLEKVQICFRKGIVYDSEYGIPLKGVDAQVRSVVRLYLPGRKAPLAAINNTDSLFWVATWQVDTLMVHEASEVASELAVKYILPTWETESRSYYAGECVQMRDAAVCVREESWEDALKLWMQVYTLKSVKYRMRAAFNIALYHEMHDDLDAAMEWIGKAKSLVELREKKKLENDEAAMTTDGRMIVLYEQQLRKRIEQFPKLKLQMQRFNGEN